MLMLPFVATLLSGADPVVATCWQGGPSVECTSDANEGKATSYCRSQCRFWAKSPADKERCREAWTCRVPGAAGVAYMPKTGALVAQLCGSHDREIVKHQLGAACPKCKVETYLLVPPKLELTVEQCHQLTVMVLEAQNEFYEEVAKYEVRKEQLDDYRAIRKQLLDDTWWERRSGSGVGIVVQHFADLSTTIGTQFVPGGSVMGIAYDAAKQVANGELASADARDALEYNIAIALATRALSALQRSIFRASKLRQTVTELGLDALDADADVHVSQRNAKLQLDALRRLRLDVRRRVFDLDQEIANIQAMQRQGKQRQKAWDETVKELKGALERHGCFEADGAPR